MASASPPGMSGPGTRRLVLPARRTSSIWSSPMRAASVLASSIASMTTFSGSSLLQPSSMTTSPPRTATTRSSSLSSIVFMGGLTTRAPSTLPMRTAETGPFQGMSESMSAVDAPMSPSRSGLFSESELTIMQWTWVSLA